MFKVGDLIVPKNKESFTCTDREIKLALILEIEKRYTVIQVVSHVSWTNIGRKISIHNEYMNQFKLADNVLSNKYVTCSCCGTKVSESKTQRSLSGKYVCLECVGVGNRGWDNNDVFHAPVKTHKTYGFEYECVPHSYKDYCSMLSRNYHLLPTFDCTLPQYGIEFKTPTYNGLNGLRKLFRTFNKYVDFSDSKCGQHINIGDTEHINCDTMKIIRKRYRTFDVLYDYFKMHPDDVLKVCGRFFTHWANREEDYSYHSSWINLEHEQRIEFRLSKFVTPNQYFALTKMWTEILDCVIDNIIKSDVLSDNEVGNLMVDIFKKYANNQAKCQLYAS